MPCPHSSICWEHGHSICNTCADALKPCYFIASGSTLKLIILKQMLMLTEGSRKGRFFQSCFLSWPINWASWFMLWHVMVSLKYIARVIISVYFMCYSVISCSVGCIFCCPKEPIKTCTRFRARVLIFNIEIPITKGFPVSVEFVRYFIYILSIIFLPF